MAKNFEEGQTLNQEDVNYLVARCRLDEALDVWGCKMGSGVEDPRGQRTNEIVAGDILTESSTAPTPPPDPGALYSVHPDQVEYIDTEGVAADGAVGDEDDEDIPPYSEWDKSDLEAEVERRELEVTGTGKDGNVLKADLVAALEEDDAASS